MDMVQRDWLQGLPEDSRTMVSDENVLSWILSWTPVSLLESVRVETEPDETPMKDALHNNERKQTTR